MSSDRMLRDHLVKLLSWYDAHASFESAIDGWPPTLRGVKVDNVPYTAWQLVEHLRLAQRDILDFCRAPTYSEGRFPDDYWPRETAPRAHGDWDRSIKAFNGDLEDLKALASDPAIDLFRPVPNGTGQTYLREILLVADHNAYHVGQLVLLRRLLGAWKE